MESLSTVLRRGNSSLVLQSKKWKNMKKIIFLHPKRFWYGSGSVSQRYGSGSVSQRYRTDPRIRIRTKISLTYLTISLYMYSAPRGCGSTLPSSVVWGTPPPTWLLACTCTPPPGGVAVPCPPLWCVVPAPSWWRWRGVPGSRPLQTSPGALE